MAILDQVELFKNSDFSGSYTDRVFRNAMPFISGTYVSNGFGFPYDFQFRDSFYTIENAPLRNSAREPIISKASENGKGKFLSDILTFPRTSFDKVEPLFFEQRDLLLGKKAGKNNLFNYCFSKSEDFIDSLLPSPLETHLVNSGSFTIVNLIQGNEDFLTISSSYESTIFTTIKNGIQILRQTQDFFVNILYDEENNILKKVPQGRLALMYYSINDELLEGLSDSKWVYDFPFEKKYSNLSKYKKPTLETKKIGNNNSIRATSMASNGFILLPNSFNLARGGSIEKITDVLPDLQSVPFDEIAGIVFSEKTKINGLPFGLQRNYSSDSNVYNIYGDILFDSDRQNEPPTLQNMYKLYFGTGKLQTTRYTLGRKGVFKNHYPINFLFSFNSPFTAIETVGITGYKYGVINHLPLPTKLAFRRGRYGQFRDLLEQRLFSKMYDNEREEPLEAVAVARFLPGTEADIVSKTGYISTEPGYFNREYQSFKPFADDVFPTFIKEEPLSNELVIV